MTYIDIRPVESHTLSNGLRIESGLMEAVIFDGDRPTHYTATALMEFLAQSIAYEVPKRDTLAILTHLRLLHLRGSLLFGNFYPNLDITTGLGIY